MTFKPGDKVRCVDDRNGLLKIGSVYEVEDTVGAQWLRLKGLPYSYGTYRFEVVKPEPHPHHHTRDAHPGNRHLDHRKEFERLVLKSLAVLLASDAEADWHFNLVKDIKDYEKDHLK